MSQKSTVELKISYEVRDYFSYSPPAGHGIVTHTKVTDFIKMVEDSIVIEEETEELKVVLHARGDGEQMFFVTESHVYIYEGSELKQWRKQNGETIPTKSGGTE